MDLLIEFTGAAQMVTGNKRINLEIQSGATYQDVVRQLGAVYPGLIGLLIDRDGETFLSGNMFIIDGNLETPAFVMNEHPQEGAHLIVMSLVTGG